MEFGIRGSATGNYPNNCYLYTNGSYKLVMDITNGNTTFFSSTDSTSYTNGSLVLNGGLGILKNLNINSLFVNNSEVSCDFCGDIIDTKNIKSKICIVKINNLL